MTRRNVQHNVAQHLARFRPSSVEEEEEEEDFTFSANQLGCKRLFTRVGMYGCV